MAALIGIRTIAVLLMLQATAPSDLPKMPFLYMSKLITVKVIYSLSYGAVPIAHYGSTEIKRMKLETNSALPMDGMPTTPTPANFAARPKITLNDEAGKVSYTATPTESGTERDSTKKVSSVKGRVQPYQLQDEQAARLPTSCKSYKEAEELAPGPLQTLLDLIENKYPNLEEAREFKTNLQSKLKIQYPQAKRVAVVGPSGAGETVHSA
jgi:hypothetical protein